MEKYKSATFHPSDSSLLLFLGGYFYDTYIIETGPRAKYLSRTIIDTEGLKSRSLSAILFPYSETNNSMFILASDFSLYRFYPYYRPGIVLSAEQWDKKYKSTLYEASPLFLQQWRQEHSTGLVVD